jgi:hypothetical protein
MTGQVEMRFSRMKGLSMQQQRSTLKKRPLWNDLAPHFADERECLASFLALETAEVLEGKKPANLLNIGSRPQACGKNLYPLWKRHGAALLRRSGLAVREMVDRGDSVLLFIYCPAALTALLAQRNVRILLGRAGYEITPDIEATLTELQSRLAGESFPHEIGIFLGYPLKDVVAFMGWVPLPFTSQGPWKIYGAPEKSLSLAETFLECRCRMASRLACCSTPVDCLKVVGSDRKFF